jgi:hypothetical protein
LSAANDSEVKGVWLVTARSWVLREHDAVTLERIASYMDRDFRSAILEPLPSQWYPEQVLVQALRALREVVAHGSNDEFRSVMESCTELGVSTFFRVLLRVSTPRFVLRQVPTMWRQIRRGRGHVVVENRPTSTVVAYSDFPWFGNVDYRLLTLGSLTAVLRVCTREPPRIRIADHGGDWLDVVVDH